MHYTNIKYFTIIIININHNKMCYDWTYSLHCNNSFDELLLYLQVSSEGKGSRKTLGAERAAPRVYHTVVLEFPLELDCLRFCVQLNLKRKRRRGEQVDFNLTVGSTTLRNSDRSRCVSKLLNTWSVSLWSVRVDTRGPCRHRHIFLC